MENLTKFFESLMKLAEKIDLSGKIDHFSNSRECADWIHGVIEEIQTILNELDRLHKIDPSKREEIGVQKLTGIFEARKQIPSNISTHFEDTKKGECKKEFDRLLNKAIEIVKNKIECKQTTNEELRKLLRKLQNDFKKNKRDVHPFPHPLKDFVQPKGWKIVVLLCIFGSGSFYLYDRYKVVPDMENSCEIPPYRSLEWIDYQPYKSIVKQSKVISGSCHIKRYISNKNNKHDLNTATNIFQTLHQGDPKSLQANFFIDYINNLKRSTVTYENSINLARQTYLYDINYPLKDEELDIIVKLSHIFMMKKNYHEANESFKYLLRKKLYVLYNNREEDYHYRNAFLGICTTHFNGNGKEQNKNDLNLILTQCKDAVKILDTEKLSNQKNEEGKDDLTKKLAIAHYNQGCVAMRLEDYSQAQKLFKTAFETAYNDDILIKNNFTIAFIFANILVDTEDGYNEAITTANYDRIDKDFALTTYQKNILLSLGIAHLAIASNPRSGTEENRKSHYKQSFEFFDRLQIKNLKEKYLLKSKECKDSLKNNKCSEQLILREDPDLIDSIHNKFSAYINHYELNPLVTSAPMPDKNKDVPKDKNNNEILDACTRINKPIPNIKKKE
jgi:hypothetical protein